MPDYPQMGATCLNPKVMNVHLSVIPFLCSMRLPNAIQFLLILTLLWSCGPSVRQDAGKPVIVTTTGIIADCISQTLGEHAEIVALMGPGVDPHLYKASQGDLDRLSNAYAIVYNGLHLEGKMAQVLQKLGDRKPTFSFGRFVPDSLLRPVSEGSALHDPHIWFDPELWLMGLKGVLVELSGLEAFKDIDLMAAYERYATEVMERAAALQNRLDAELPAGKRHLITSHDAFAYFGRAFDFKVRGLQGISTAAEFGIRDVQDLIDHVIDHDIAAVFVETSISDKNLRSVVDGAAARNHVLRIGGSLYSDALGEEGGSASTYLGMLETNVNTLINGLRHE